MKCSKINSPFLLGLILIVLQGCFPQKPDQEVWPKFVARSTPERNTNGIVRDWSTNYGPFSPRSVLEYFVADSSDVLLLLIGFDGGTVDTLVNKRQGPGLYEALLSGGTGSDAGTYTLELHIGDYVETKMTLFPFLL